MLRELAELILDLGDLGRSVVLIGGQVLALHSRAAGGTGSVDVRTDTGITVERGFSMEPDLLFDFDEDTFTAERLTEVLHLRGYLRARDFRWAKALAGDPGFTMQLDLFAPSEVPTEVLPTPMTPLPDGYLALRRKVPVELLLDEVTLRIHVPDPVAFLSLKVRAKREQRPDAHKGFLRPLRVRQARGRAGWWPAPSTPQKVEPRTCATACASSSGASTRQG